MSEEHPHELRRTIPDRIPAATLRELSRIRPARALGAMLAEWVGIMAAIALGLWQPHPALYVLIVLWIGARQHALAILVHDAVHYRFLENHRINDVIANIFLAWPIFITVEGFRHFHSDHHRFTNAEGDGNRILWRTHDAAGHLAAEWRYPKSAPELLGRLLWRASGVTGIWWILRGLLVTFRIPAATVSRVGKLAAYAVLAAALTQSHQWGTFFFFWIVPYCTWQIFIQYLRLICEHSAVPSTDPEYGVTRSTLPSLLGRLFVLPLNVGYHIEHHWYPSVPFYRLPALHAALMQQPGFAARAVIRRSIFSSISECVRG